MTEKRATDHLEPAAKKRGSERQITKDDASDEDVEEVPHGTFARASEEVLKQRKIVRARRGPTTSGAVAQPNPFANVQLAQMGTTTAAPNPFAGISLVPAQPLGASDKQNQASEAETNKEEEEEKEGNVPQNKNDKDGTEAKDVNEDATPKPKLFETSGGFSALGAGTTQGFGSFGALATSGTATGGFGSLAAGAPAPAFGQFGASSAFARGAATEQPSIRNFLGGSVATEPVSSPAPFGDAGKAARPDIPKEAPPETGEEAEITVFSGSGILFEFDQLKQWRERGRGEMRVNVDEASGHARLVMRQKGNLRLLLNANLWAEMQLTMMEGGSGVTFACVNHLEDASDGGGEASKKPEEGNASVGKLATYALRIKPMETLEQFIKAVEQHKGGRSALAYEGA